MTHTILVIGDALLDIRVVPEGEPRPGGDRPARVRLEPGGQGANVAVRLARRGGSVTLACALGDDLPGEMVRRALAAEGVALIAAPAGVTGVVALFVDPSGERSMLSQRVPLLEALELPADAHAWTIVSGYLLLEPGAARLSERLPAGGHRAVVGCALEPEHAFGWSRALDALAPDILVLNRAEAAVLTGAGPDETDANLAAVIARRGIDVVAVTGPSGATLALGGGDVAAATPPGTPAVDTTGAGDAFAAALVDGLAASADWPPGETIVEPALRVAVDLAAAVARVPGAQTRVAEDEARS